MNDRSIDAMVVRVVERIALVLLTIRFCIEGEIVVEEPEPIEVRIFFSYAHSDEESLRFIAPLKSSLELFVTAKSGRSARVFLDKDGLGWGQDWREQIDSALKESVIFMPFVTPAYLKSEHCRDEFLAFMAHADELGLDKLILPVLPLQTSVVTAESADEIAAYAARHQHKQIEAAVLSGQDSADWRRTSADLANSLLDALTLAEAQLVELSKRSVEKSEKSLGAAGETEGESGDSDYFELSLRAEAASNDFMRVAKDVEQSAKAFAGAIQTFDTSKTTSPREAQIRVFSLADSVRQPADDLERTGKGFRAVVSELDVVIRETLAMLEDAGDLTLIGRTKQDLRKLADSTAGLDDLDASIAGTLSSIRPMEVLSSPLRKALRPARTGMTALRDGLRTARSWRDLDFA